MPGFWVARFVAGRRRRRSLALAVRLFECGGEPEMARTVLTLGAASLFDRYLAGDMGLAQPAPASPEELAPGAGKRIVPFPRTMPGEGA